MSFSGASKTSAMARAIRAGGVLLVVLILQHGSVAHAELSPLPLRAVFVTAAQLGSADAPRRILAAAMADGFDTVFVPITLDGATGAAAEALDSVIREAHERGLRVHGSIQVLKAARADELPSSRDHVIYRNPQWLMVPRELGIEMLNVDPRSPDYIGRLARWTRANSYRADGLYLSALQPDAADYIVTAVKRLLVRFPVDGVHLEGLRFPGPEFDYNRRSQDAFRQERRLFLDTAARTRLDEVETIDPFGYTEEFSDEWRRFRTTRLTALVAQIRTAVRSIRPEAVVSATVLAGAERALNEHLQDWQTWLDNGFVDALAEENAATTLLSSYETLVNKTPPSAPAPGTDAPSSAGSQ
jgi:uncharacterized lipoprotein YddW (UPF0748 family)